MSQAKGASSGGKDKPVIGKKTVQLHTVQQKSKGLCLFQGARE